MAFIAPLIAGIAGFFGASAAVAGFLGSFGAALLGLGASFALSAIFGRKKADTISGTQSEVKFGGEVPRQIIFGTAATAGHCVYINSWGDSNSHEEEVYVLADVECTELVGLIVDGEEKTLVPQAPLHGEDARFFVNDKDNGNSDTTDDAAHYGAKLEIRFYRGARSQTADAGLIGHGAGRWTTSHRGDGVCYVVVDKTYDTDLFPGFPTFKFIVRGAKLYDWRLDDTAGGTGSHRFDDPTTWEYSENPAVCLYAYQRGFWRAGKILLGQGVPMSDLPLDLYSAAANICDEEVEKASGGTEARYAVGAISSDDTEHRTVMEALVGAMGGWLYESAGVFLPVAGAARTVSATITDGDLLLDGSVKVTRKRSRSELVNYVSGTFTSPDDLWESKGYTAIRSDANEGADGERLGRILDYPQVNSPSRAERLARLRYNENRCQTTATVPLSLRQIGIEVGDWIRWNSARWGDRVYRVRNWQLSLIGGSIGMQVGLEEIAASVYGWNPLTDEGPAIISGSPRTDGVWIRTITGLTVQASSATSAIGETIPALFVSWMPPADETIVAVVIEYRRSGEAVASTVRSDTPTAGAIEITGLLGGADYEVRATIVTDPARTTAWTSWMPIATTATELPLAVDTPDLVPSLAGQIETLAATVETLQETQLRELLARKADRTRARTIGAAVETKVTEKYDAVTGALASRLDTVEAGVATASSAITDEATARADADGALATRLTAVEAETDGAFAAIQAEESARATADAALASRATVLEADVGTLSASIAAEATARSDADGALASSISSLQTSLDGVAASVQTEATARSSADAALATSIETVQSAVEGNTAAIQTEATTRASADAAQASSLTSLASDLTTTTGRVGAVETGLSAETTARSSADDQLSTRVTATEGAITSQAASLTSLTSDLSALDGRVAGAETGLTDEAAARATADGQLSTRVTATEGAITSQASQITSLDTRLMAAEGDVSATSSALTALSTTVSGQGDDLTALSGAVTDLSAATEAATADGSIKFVAAVDQTGALARYELVAKTALAGAGSDAEAAMVIEAVSDGAANVSQVKFRADRFYIMSDTGEVVPFAVIGGSVFIDQLQVRTDLLIGAGGYGGSILISD